MPRTTKTTKKTAAPVKKAVRNAVVKESSKVSHGEAPVFAVSGKQTGTMALPKELFEAPVNKQAIAQAVRVYRLNQRAGGASTKTRGEVEGSTRKIYKQKGTGRARHGSIRAPIFVGGGIVFGPQPHAFTRTLPQAMKRVALSSICTLKLKEAEVSILDCKDVEPKTKPMAACLKTMGITKSVLLVVASMHDSVVRAAKNIANVTITQVSQLTTYDVVTNHFLCLTKEAVQQLSAKTK